ncbi:ComEC/Rec2 family competence protein [Cysteiniphilum litorale]|uniref:ComEC/Rec2 family competence protein n=1 Tax=Cysteiniphilum litorale TaxID=2056700 RepID=UPI001E4230C7|nr:hypothetical protein [Cysteiniphilum litorale]
MAFFNVGQGNFVIAKDDKKKNILIVDSGSLKNPKNIKNKVNIKQEDVAAYASTWIGTKEKYKLTIVLSHPDIDHTNLVYRLLLTTLTKGIGKKGAFQEISIIIGNQYSIEQYIKSSETIPDTRISTIKTYVKKQKEITKTYDFGDSTLVVLNNEDLTNNNDTNRNSLLVYLESRQNIKFLFTGDATKKTFLCNKKNFIKYTQNVDVLLASHHGSDTEGSNEKDIIENRIKPKYVIFSAPRYSTHRHPAYSTIDNYTLHTLRNNIKKPNHFIFVDRIIDSTEKSKFNFERNGQYMRVCKTYRTSETQKGDMIQTLYETNLPIYHTGSHGTIIFTTESTRNALQINSYDYESKTTKLVDNKALNPTSYQEIIVSVDNFLAF